MDNQKNSEGHDAQYYELLRQKIRDIRQSEMTARKKIKELIDTAVDYDAERDADKMSEALQTMSLMDNVRLMRMFNALSMLVEESLRYKHLTTLDTFCRRVEELSLHVNRYPLAYLYTCYAADYDEEEWEKNENEEPMVSLPEELLHKKFYRIILRVLDADYILETFPWGHRYNISGYDILAKLEKEVMGYEDGLFPSMPMVPYNSESDVVFEFSHFEINTEDPDASYHTLYVFYQFSNTVG